MPEAATKADVPGIASPIPSFREILPARLRRLAPKGFLAEIPRRSLGRRKKPAKLPPTFTSLDLSYSPNDENEVVNYHAPSSPCPEFTLPEDCPDTPLLVEDYPDTPLLEEDSDISIFDPTELRNLFEITNELSIDPPLENFSSPAQVVPLISAEDHPPLTHDERTDFYNLINGSIHSSGEHGERSGTYSAFMEEQSRHYFDRLARSTSSIRKRANNSRPVTGPVSGEVDFQKWLAASTRDSFRPYVETDMTYIHDHRTWVSDIGGDDDVDVDSLILTYLGPAVADIEDDLISPLASGPNSLFEPRPFQDEEGCSSRATTRSTDNSNIRTLPSRGLNISQHDHFPPSRSMPHIIRSRTRTNSAGGGI